MEVADESATRARSDRNIKLYYFARHFLGTENCQDQMPNEEGIWLKPCYFEDEEMTE